MFTNRSLFAHRAWLSALIFCSSGLAQAQSPISEVDELVASDGQPSDWFGFSVAVDGDTTVVGAYTHQVNGKSLAGAAYVYVYDNVQDDWVEVQKLTISEPFGSEQFGFSVAIDEDTIVVGANGEWHSNSFLDEDKGAAYVFSRQENGSWQQQQRLVASNPAAYDTFGDAVTVIGDTILVGARGVDADPDMGLSNTGAVYVFVNDNSCGQSWCEEAMLEASDGGQTDYFGSAADLTDGPGAGELTAVIGAPLDDVSGNVDAGSAYVFTRTIAGWVETVKLTNGDPGPADNFGGSVAVDGDTVVVGASFRDVMCDTEIIVDAGVAYVFHRDAGVWGAPQCLAASDAAAVDRFGVAVDVDSNLMLIGAHLAEEDTGDANQGAAYLFKKNNELWSEKGRFVATFDDDGENPSGTGDALGQAVALSGFVVMAGTPFDDDLGASSGSVYVFDAQIPTFDDVPSDYWAFSFIERLAESGITSGCGNDNYCPSDPVTRAQMAVFLERGINGSGFSPPAATGNLFNDVGAGDFAASFIEQLANDGITAGCGNNNYCPNATVTRDQMAVFLLRAKYGSDYSPPAPTGVFGDVDMGYWAAAWIEQLAAEGITSGCGGGNYCPEAPVNRDQMAVFLVRTFGL